MTDNNPHMTQPMLTAGQSLDSARAAMIMIHGRGATAESILQLSEHFKVDGFAYLAPQAMHNTWYPQRFIVPQVDNEPWLSHAKDTVAHALQTVFDAGIPAEKVILLGFSQGACLATEYPARHPQRYGGIVALSGGLIGTDEEIIGYTGSLDGTPTFLGCSDVDFHIPKERVQATADALEGIGADVTMTLYPNMGHTVNMDEVQHIQRMMDGVLA